tara:strand:- start:199 stop:399 length:201 start_codon:yes stop_codon:yes gene_type:complete
MLTMVLRPDSHVSVQRQVWNSSALEALRPSEVEVEAEVEAVVEAVAVEEPLETDDISTDDISGSSG